jgi:hypothetical protein
MKQIIWVAIFSLSLLILTFDAQSDVKPIKDNIVNTHYFKDIAIHSVENYIPPEKKIIVQSVTFESNTLQDKLEPSEIAKIPDKIKDRFLAKIPKLGQTLWTITGDQLPVTEHDCMKALALLCSEYDLYYKSLNPNPRRPVCSANCILYGPEFLAFDEKLGVIYIGAQIGDGGSGGWTMLTFAVNLQTKKIKPLALEPGTVKASLSPSGTYLTLYGGSYLAVINTRNGEEFSILEHPLTRGNRFVGITDLKWLDNETIQYQKGEYTDKFAGEAANVVTEKILDIRSRKTRNVS